MGVYTFDAIVVNEYQFGVIPCNYAKIGIMEVDHLGNISNVIATAVYQSVTVREPLVYFAEN